VLQPDPTQGKPTFDLASPGLRLILESAMHVLDSADYAERIKLINAGSVSGRARYVGMDVDFAIFDWAGKTLVWVRSSILP
jgi:hypothetical protein